MSGTEILSRSQTESSPAFVKAFGEAPGRCRHDGTRRFLPPAPVWGRFLQLAPAGFAEFWVTTIGGENVGRIGAARLPSYPGSGAIGFFEVDTAHPDFEAISTLLLETAEKWLKAQGIRQAVGPMCLNTWFPYRFRTDHDTDRAFAWEPNQPAEYPRVWEKLGYRPLEQYGSYGTGGLEGYVAKTETAYRKCLDFGFTFRPFDDAHILETEVPLLHAISMEGFKDNFLFEPIPLELFRELYVPFAKTMDFSHAYFAVAPTGEEVGFFFCFLEGKRLMLKSTTVLPKYRGLGLSNALTYLAGAGALAKGADEYVPALVKAGAQSESYHKKGESRWAHRYTLYEKPL